MLRSTHFNIIESSVIIPQYGLFDVPETCQISARHLLEALAKDPNYSSQPYGVDSFIGVRGFLVSWTESPSNSIFSTVKPRLNSIRCGMVSLNS